MLRWLVLDKLDWLYLHISSGRNGAFLFGFTTMAELILLFVWVILGRGGLSVLMCRNRKISLKRAKASPRGITNTEDRSSEGVGKDVRLFGLVSVRVTWLGGLGAVYAVCKFG